MAKKITQEEIIDKNIWENTIKSTKELINQVDILQDELKKVAETSAKIVKESNKPTFESLKQADEEVNKLNKAFEGKILLDKERLKLEKQLATAQAKLSLQNEKVVTDLAREKEALRKSNAEKRLQAKISKTQVGSIENLRAKLSLVTLAWTKLTAAEIENTKRGKRLNESKKQLTAELKKLESATGDNRREVGNYGKGLDGLKGRFRSLAGALGIGLGIQAVRSFSSELIELNNQSKGINFAFDRLGQRGADAFNRVKTATKGLMADLDIKQSLVEFDNFNLSLEQSDTLFEFLAVTATQTGKSVDKLKESLVEGLSKESKLRIDNLGISAMQLNEELERTPNFIDAVANIAKLKVSQAGDILTEAGSSQERWNVRIKNTKEILARQLQPVFESVFSKAATALEFISDNFTTLINTIKILIPVLTAYTVGTKLNTAATVIWTTVTEGATIAERIRTAVTLSATKAVKAFNIAMRNNPLGLILALIAAVTAAYYTFKDSVDLAKEAQEEFNKTRAESIEAQDKVNQEEDKLLKKRFEALENDAEKRKLLGENSNKVDLDLLKQKKEIIKEEQKALEDQVIRQRKIRIGLIIEEDDEGTQTQVSEARIQGTIESLKNREIALNEEIRKIEDDASKSGIKKFKEREEDFKTFLRRIKDLQNQAIKDDEKREIALTKTKFNREISAITGNSEVEKQLRSELENAKLQELSEINERYREQEQEQYDEDQRKQEQIEKDLAEDKKQRQKKEADEARALIAKHNKEKQDEADKAAKLAKEKEIENREKTLATLSALNDKFFNDKKTKLDNEITEAKEREQTLEQLAIQGNKQASESLASNQKEQAEANAKKEQLLKQEKANEMALAIINAFNASLDSGKSTGAALSEAILSVGVLAGSLPSFYEGTENTGTVSNPLDSNGGRVSILHNNERVLTEKQNKLIGDYSNEDVANTMYKLNNGLLTDVTDLNTPHINLQQTRFESNEAILNKFDNLEKSIVSAINDKETYLGSDVDTIKRVINQHYKKNGTKTTIKTKSKLW